MMDSFSKGDTVQYYDIKKDKCKKKTFVQTTLISFPKKDGEKGWRLKTEKGSIEILDLEINMTRMVLIEKIRKWMKN